MASVGVQKVTISNLEPDIGNALIIGIIIGKQRPKKFLDIKSTESNAFRAVWNFTLRDSLRDFINVTFWADSDTIFQANDSFHTGDVVEIIRPKITIRSAGEFGEQFRPIVTSPYHLILNEISEIKKHDIRDANVYYKLLRYPTKPITGFVSLLNIQNRGSVMSAITVDTLGAIRTLGATRMVKTKIGDEVQLKEMYLFDHTCSSIKVTLWEPDVIARSASWQPRSTILFLTDVKAIWSSYLKSYEISLTNRTIITENPVGREAEELRKYAATATLENSSFLDQFITNIPDPNTIQNVMTVHQVHDKLNVILNDTEPGDKHFTALLFAVITQLDLDGLSRTTTSKCGKCNSYLKFSNAACENTGCPVALGTEYAEPNVTFNIRLMLSDHTGTLVNCRLYGKVAEDMFNCSVDQFLNMSDLEKSSLKWNYLTERCAVRIIAMINRRSPVISIVSCSLADNLEVNRRLPIY